ncbi:MAG: GntG family PLP-dependent aldolase [Bacteroidota bacterium]|nr:GntG family PLP-dependent aldolase [Bacteroidota bacterium]
MQKKIDLRSDTVSLPTSEMIEAITKAKLGDDVLQEDSTVIQLEKEAAMRLGKEAALLVPSGTFGNQAAVYTHTNQGDEVILADRSHIVQHEVGAASVISGVQLRTIHSDDGMITAKAIEELIRKEENIHYPKTGLIALQNPLGNGRVVPLNIFEEIKELANHYGIPVHLDGARIFNAATYLKTDVKNISAIADSVMFCLSKGLGAPVGSILTGSKAFIKNARKTRKLMGGGMRQAGIIAAPGIYALNVMTQRLEEDHDNIRRLAKALQNYELFDIDFSNIHTNILYIGFHSENKNTGHYFTEILNDYGILCYPPYYGQTRFVAHHNVSSGDIDYIINLLPEITVKLRNRIENPRE